MASVVGWQGGPFFHKIRRGSRTSRAGGTNSGNAGRRFTRFMPCMISALMNKVRAKNGKVYLMQLNGAKDG